MPKKEIIWRYILYHSLEAQPRTISFTQKDIAQKFNFSTSTVFNALKAPRELGAIEVTGRFFRVRDAEKLLLLWATNRLLQKDIIYETHVPLDIHSIENSVPNEVIFGAYTAYRLKYNEAPAEYSTIYVYSYDITELKKRFSPNKGYKNLFVLKPDPYLASFGSITPDVQTFVDLWNLSEWYAKDFLTALKTHLHL